MKRVTIIAVSILTIILAYLLIAFAWSTNVGHPESTICLILGIVLFSGGIVLLIIGLKIKKLPDFYQNKKFG